MDTVQHNIEKEKTFIDLLGYTIIGPDNNNRWIIIDQNSEKVGYIQYKKLKNKNKKKGIKAIYGYETFIDSSSIKYIASREINEENEITFDKINLTIKNYFYKFLIKKANNEEDYIEMHIGDEPSLIICSKEYGYINFSIMYCGGLYLNYKSKTDNFNIEEVLTYHNTPYYEEHRRYKEYSYQIRYCKKNFELSDSNPKGRTDREIAGKQPYYENYFNDKKILKISTKTWVNGQLKAERENDVEGTVEEMAAKNEMGLDCFNHFRFLANQIIPFNKDVISAIVSDKAKKYANMEMFFNTLEKEKKYAPTKKKLISKKKKEN